MAAPVLTTERLILRGWLDRDREPFAAINADPIVMQHMPSTLDRTMSDAVVDRFVGYFERLGFGPWVVEERASGRSLGFVGLAPLRFEPPFATRDSPPIELAYRLAASHHGLGLATEAAHRALEFGFGTANLAEVLAFTSTDNLPSLRVMAKLNMSHDPAEDFIHPQMPADHRLQPMRLHRLSGSDWSSQTFGRERVH